MSPGAINPKGVDMIVEYIRYRIPHERRSRFETAYRDAAASLDASGHCLAYELIGARA